MKTQKILSLLAFTIISLTFSRVAKAEGGISWSELRLFGTSNKFSTAPDSLNNLTATDKVNSLSSLTGLGFEADFKVLSFLKAGLRYAGVWTLMTPDNAPNPPTSFLAVQQTKFGLVLRIPLFENDWLRSDLFGEGGTASSHIDVQTTGAGQGTFTKAGSFYKRAGASVGFGWKTIFFFVEAGQEWNSLDGVSFAGTLSNSITSIDLSGSYYCFGLTFNGIPGWIKFSGSKSDK